MKYIFSLKKLHQCYSINFNDIKSMIEIFFLIKKKKKLHKRCANNFNDMKSLIGIFSHAKKEKKDKTISLQCQQTMYSTNIAIL